MVKMFDKVIYDDLYKLREEFYPHILICVYDFSTINDADDGDGSMGCWLFGISDEIDEAGNYIDANRDKLYQYITFDGANPGVSGKILRA